VKNTLNLFGNCIMDKPWENVSMSFGHGTTSEHEIYVRGSTLQRKLNNI
jgi:hypothetical protein